MALNLISNYEIRLMAKDYLKDFDLYDASFDVVNAYEYLIKLTASKDDKVKDAMSILTTFNGRNVASTIKANYRRYKQVLKHCEKEIGDVSEDYRELYEDEKALLEDYCYACLGDMMKVIHPAEYEKVQIEYAEKIAEEKAKREQAKANRSLAQLEKALAIAEGVKNGYVKRADEKELDIQALKAQIEEKKKADKAAKKAAKSE